MVREAVGLLRASDLTASYEETWQEWSDSGDESLWDAAVGDGIDAVYEAYDCHLLDEPDKWGDLATFLRANLLQKRTIPQTLSYPRTPRLREGSESCGRWASGCCFGCGAFSAGPGGGGPDTFSVG